MHHTHCATPDGSSLPLQKSGCGLRFLALAGSSLLACIAQAADAPHPLYLRNTNPLLQTLGAPSMQGGELAPAGTLDYRLVLNMANHADSGLNDGEESVFDGESYYLDLMLRYGLGSRLEVGMDLPLVAHTGGIFDDLIKDWHDLLGLSNHDRPAPDNMVRFFYQHDGVTEYDIDDSEAGLGDVRLVGAYRLAASAGRALSLRAQLELPTGDSDRLRGNGAVDLSLVLDATDRRTFAAAGVSLFGRLGMVAPGNGDLIKDLQEDWVPLLGAGLAWQWNGRVGLHAQLDYEGAYFDSGLEEFDSATRITLGGSYQFGGGGPRLSLALTENLFSDAVPDFGLYFALTMNGSLPP